MDRDGQSKLPYDWGQLRQTASQWRGVDCSHGTGHMHGCIAWLVDVFVALVFHWPLESFYFKPIQALRTLPQTNNTGCAVAKVLWKVLSFNTWPCFRFAAATLLVSGPKPIRVTLGHVLEAEGLSMNHGKSRSCKARCDLSPNTSNKSSTQSFQVSIRIPVVWCEILESWTG